MLEQHFSGHSDVPYRVANRQMHSQTLMQVAEESRSALPPKLMLMLREFLQQFLALGYGPLMETIREKLEPGLGVSRLDPEDFLRFVQLARLCTSFTFIQQASACRALQEDAGSWTS